MAKLSINGTQYNVDLPEDTPLLWVLRDSWASPGPSSAAAWRCAAPARCTSTASRCARA